MMNESARDRTIKTQNPCVVDSSVNGTLVWVILAAGAAKVAPPKSTPQTQLNPLSSATGRSFSERLFSKQLIEEKGKKKEFFNCVYLHLPSAHFK